jgi:hypothetical protein
MINKLNIYYICAVVKAHKNKFSYPNLKNVDNKMKISYKHTKTNTKYIGFTKDKIEFTLF